MTTRRKFLQLLGLASAAPVVANAAVSELVAEPDIYHALVTGGELVVDAPIHRLTRECIVSGVRITEIRVGMTAVELYKGATSDGQREFLHSLLADQLAILDDEQGTPLGLSCVDPEPFHFHVHIEDDGVRDKYWACHQDEYFIIPSTWRRWS